MPSLGHSLSTLRNCGLNFKRDKTHKKNTQKNYECVYAINYAIKLCYKIKFKKLEKNVMGSNGPVGQ